MSDPFTVLGVSADANDEQIKAAYLQRVKAYPPERAPARFQTIRAAYDAIHNREARLRYRLFEQAPPAIEELIAAALAGTKPQRPEQAAFQRVLQESLGLK